MPYVTQSDMVALFPLSEMVGLTNLDDPAATTVNTNRLDAAIAHAESIIDSYLGVRHSLPLATTPVVLTGYAADITRYVLDSTRAREDVRQRYEDAIVWLKMLAKGEVVLDLDAGDQPASIALSKYQGPSRVYGSDSSTWIGWD